MTKKEQETEIVSIVWGAVTDNSYRTKDDYRELDTEDIDKLTKQVAEQIYNVGYRKTFTSDFASDTQKAFKDGYIKGIYDRMDGCDIIKDEVRKETAKEILDILYDMGIDKETLECCRIFDVNGVSLAKQICEKYDVEIENDKRRD